MINILYDEINLTGHFLKISVFQLYNKKINWIKNERLFWHHVVQE